MKIAPLRVLAVSGDSLGAHDRVTGVQQTLIASMKRDGDRSALERATPAFVVAMCPLGIDGAIGEGISNLAEPAALCIGAPCTACGRRFAAIGCEWGCGRARPTLRRPRPGREEDRRVRSSDAVRGGGRLHRDGDRPNVMNVLKGFGGCA